MSSFRKVLVAVDLASIPQSLAITAAMLSRTFGSAIHLLHVVPEQEDDSRGNGQGKASVVEALRDFRARLESRGTHVADASVLTGVASYRICQQADLLDVDLIVMAAGNPANGTSDLGVTARRVLSAALKPVWLVETGPASAPHSILCPIDQSAASRRALAASVLIGRHLRAELTVLCVYEQGSASFGRLNRGESRQESDALARFQAGCNRFLEQQDFNGINWRSDFREGVPHTEILRAAKREGCNLIVMGTVGRRAYSLKQPGTVTSKVARAMPCSILTVKEDNFIRRRLDAAISNVHKHMGVGAKQLEKGRPTEAIAEYERCLLSVPVFAPAWDKLADAYAQLNDPDQADRCREAARQIRETLWQDHGESIHEPPAEHD